MKFETIFKGPSKTFARTFLFLSLVKCYYLNIVTPTKKLYVLLAITSLLVVTSVVLWSAVLSTERSATLTVSFLDVGQGDAIFIETPSKRQILIDGGKGSAVLQELSKVMPFWDRTIDMVIATHPDADHTGGLAEVVSRYEVGTFVHSGVNSETSISEELFTTLAKEDVQEILARRGQMFDFGDGAYITVLFPDRDVAELESNAASVILKVTFGENSFLLTGDSPQSIEKYVVSLDREQLSADVLKAGHHGSKTSSSPLLVGFVNPQYAVLSYGCDNSYGHPNQEVLDTLNNFEIEILETCKEGRITFTTDGNIMHIK